MRRSLRTDERGVSVVVGAILIFAVGITILASVRATFVPNMESEAEASHMRSLSQQLVGLRADLQRQIELDQSTVLSHAIQMGRPKVGIFDGGQSPDHLGLIFPDQRLVVSSPRALVEDPSAGATESWKATPVDSIVNIKEVSSLRLRANEVTKTFSGSTATLSVFEQGSGEFRGCVRLRIDDMSSSDYYIIVETYDASQYPTVPGCPAVPPNAAEAAALVNREIRAYHQSHGFRPYFVDALDPAYRFDRVLASAAPPFRIDLAFQGLMQGSYAIQYLAYTSTGPGLPLGGGGVAVEDYSKPFRGGFLEYEATNRHYVGQTYRVEHGALILVQPQGAVFRSPPDLRVDVINGVAGLVATVPSLSGDARTLSSQGTSTIRTSVVEAIDVSLHGPRLTLTLDTRHPELWRAFFEEHLTQAFAALPPALPGQPYWSVGVAGDSIVLTIYGPNFGDSLPPVPPSTQPTYINDVRLLLHHAKINVELNP